MINNLKNNWLLLQLVVIYTLYVVIGSSIQRPLISSAVGILSLIAGVFMLVGYAPKAWDIIWKQERGKYGAHNAILGAAELALGLVYSGGYRLIWNHFDRPEAWSGTMLSSLGLFLVAKGAFRMSVVPNEHFMDAGFPEGFWKLVVIIFGLIFAFVAGASFGSS